MGAECTQGVDECGNTAIHLSAAHGHLDVVKLLTVYSPLGKRFNHFQQLPIHLAVAAGYVDVTRFLVTCNSTVVHRQDIAGIARSID